jgi:hypothetical protein
VVNDDHATNQQHDNNDCKRHTTGGLEISTNANGQDIVEGYDESYSLPLPVALMLAEKGYGFAPYVFPEDAIKKSLFGL